MSMLAVMLPMVSLSVLFLPGLVINLLAGLRPGAAVAVAPVVTYGVTTATATVGSYVPRRVHLARGRRPGPRVGLACRIPS